MEVLEREFSDVVCADDELVRAEFEAIVAAAWDGPGTVDPERPTRRGGGHPVTTSPREDEAFPCGGHDPPSWNWEHERAPPARGR